MEVSSQIVNISLSFVEEFETVMGAICAVC